MVKKKKVNDWRPRLSLEIDPEQYQKLQSLIPWGVKNQIFRVIISDLIEVIEKEGPLVIAALLSRKIKLSDIVRGDSNEHNR